MLRRDRPRFIADSATVKEARDAIEECIKLAGIEADNIANAGCRIRYVGTEHEYEQERLKTRTIIARAKVRREQREAAILLPR